ncbi:MAG: CHAT domain-containing protein [Cyanobacteria bacterium J06621_11]
MSKSLFLQTKHCARIVAHAGRLVVILIGMLLAFRDDSLRGMAQVVPDNTLGPESSLVPIGAADGSLPNVLIEGGAQRNTTLFHSFEQFNVNANQQVRFANPVDVDNIFSRVTGGMPSNIDGLLGVNGLANLFFLNPSGVVFGENASLDLSGAFVVTTGDRIAFPEGNTFSAVNPEAAPMLTVSTPLGIQFGRSPQPIALNGAILELAIDQPIALLGGNVALNDAELVGFGGRLVLGGLAGAGEATLVLDAPDPQAVLAFSAGSDLADINLEGTEIISTGVNGGNDIILQGEDITLSRSEVLMEILESDGMVEGQSETIFLTASGDISIFQGSSIGNLVEGEAFGQGGNIVIRAENLEIIDGIVITLAESEGSTAGDIDVDVSNRIFGTAIELLDEAIFSSGSEDVLGQPGNIRLTARNIQIENEIIIETAAANTLEGGDIIIRADSLDVARGSNILAGVNGSGRSGDIRIQANNIVLDDRGEDLIPFETTRFQRGITTEVSSESVDAVGGDVVIDTQNLTLIGSLLGATVFGENGTGGNIIVRAEDTVRLIGDDAASRDGLTGVGEIATALRTDNERISSGGGGNIQINARVLSLENGAIIDAAADGIGDSGSVRIRTRDALTLQGRLNGQPSRIVTQLQNSQAGNTGGDITIQTGQLTVQDAGQISAGTLGIGASGRVRVEATEGITLAGAIPASELSAFDGASPFVLDATGRQFPGGIFADSTSTIARAADGETLISRGAAGDIALITPRLEVRDRAQISVRSTTAGAAGNITANTDNLILDNGIINAETIEGDNANIDLTVRESASLLNGSQITTNASGSATGGNLRIAAPNLILLSNQSALSAENSGGTGNGGNITLDSELFVAAPNGANRVIANAFEGDGGNIDLTTMSLLGDAFLDISASSELGLDGQVEINSVDLNPVEALVPLPENLVNTEDQIADACAIDEQARSQFVSTRRGGLPPLPTSLPTGLTLLSDLGTGLGASDAQTRAIPSGAVQIDGNKIPIPQEAQRWTVSANGQVQLTVSDDDSRGISNEISQAPSLAALLETASQAYVQGDYAQAANLWEQVLTLPEAEPLIQISAQSNLALTYHHLGQWTQAEVAITASQQQLTSEITAAHPNLLAQVLSAEASLQLARGQARTAIDTWQQASVAYRQTNDILGQRQVLLNQAQALKSLGFNRQAKTQIEKLISDLDDQSASESASEINREMRAIALLSLGNLQRAEGKLTDAQQTLENALVIAQSLKRSDLTSPILINLGHTAQANQTVARAQSFYQQASASASTPLAQFQAQLSAFELSIGQTPAESSQIWANQSAKLQQQLAALPTSRAATYARLRLVKILLDAEIPPASSETILFLLTPAHHQAQSLEDPMAAVYALGYQGQLYGKAQQWSEAIALSQSALAKAQTLQAPEMAYQWAWQLGRGYSAQGDDAKAIAAYTIAIEELRTLRIDLASTSVDVQFEFRDGVEPVYRELVKLLLRTETAQPVSQSNLKQARVLIEDLQLAELNDYFQDACVQSSPVAADSVDSTAAVIYPILLDDRLDVIVSIAGTPMRHYSTPLNTDQLEETVNQLLKSLTTPLGASRTETTAQLQQLYNWMLRPVVNDLAQHEIETLVFVADGPLRTLPLSALHDGEKYLIENYNVTLSPGLNLLDPRPLERQGINMLAAGLSESRSGFPALPFIEDELAKITTHLPNNQLLFNQRLTKENLINHLKTSPADVVHLATHGEFGSSSEETFILTWEGKFTLKEIGSVLQARHRSRVDPVELLVFSACKTATGDSRAVLGIAGMAIRSDVRSALAGLWHLNDQATATFMAHFYESLAQPEVTKADAIRQAQLALLNDPQLSSPYYWSPFVLVGNWL